MRTCLLNELKPGDIFTHEIKLNGREAFKVIDHKTKKTTICKSRTTGLEIRKKPDSTVIYLRTE